MASVSKEALLKIVGDDTDAEAKLDAISAKADKLREEHPELTVRIDTAEATAKLAVFREELKAATKSMTADVDAKAGPSGLLGSLLYGAGNAAGAAGGEGGGLVGFVQDNPAMLAIFGTIATLAAPAAVELGALATGLTAAAGGIGALGLVAIPTFDKVKSALSDTPAQLAKLPAPLQQAVGGIHTLERAFGKLGTAFQPRVLGLLNQGLGIANQLLPDVASFAGPAANAFKQLGDQVSKIVKSKAFKQFVDQMAGLSGPAITAIGGGLIRLGGAFANLMKLFTKKDVVTAIDIAFDILAGAVDTAAWSLKQIMIIWDNTSKAAKIVAHDVVTAFDVVKDLFTVDIPKWAGDTVTFFKGLPGKIVSALGNTGTLLVNAGKSIIDGLVSGVESKVGGLLSTIGGIAGKVASTFGHLLGIGSPSRVFAEHGRDIIAGLEQGLNGAAPNAYAAMSRVASGLTVGTGRTGAGAAAAVTLQVEPGGNTAFEQFMVQSLRQWVRVRGGGGANSVQRALGQTS